jgi:serine protease Do
MNLLKQLLVLPCALLVICNTTPANAAPAPESFADLVEQLMPTVVNVSTTQKASEKPIVQQFTVPNLNPNSPLEDFREFFEQMPNPEEMPDQKAISLGSGVIIDKDGYIITNNHVVQDAEDIVITFSDDSQAHAKVVGTDEKTDLALLKLDVGRKLPAAKFGDSETVRVGDWVLAIGNPFGLGGSVTAGIISARARDINAGPFDDFLQTDAAINKGNSGGPMFNTKGELIGINTAIFSPSGGSVGIGFAVPSEIAQPVIDQLKKHGRTFRGWLGVKIQTMTEDIAEGMGMKDTAGALIAEVSKDSPAEKAGIKVGDVIVRFDNKPIMAMRKLPRIVAETEIGKHVEVVVWRNGEKKTLTVVLGELKEDKPSEEASETNGDEKPIANQEELLGMSLAPLTDALRKQYNLDKAQGLLVVKRDVKSAAAEKGIRAGDVITMANQQPTRTVSDLKDAVKRAKGDKKKSVLLLVNRGGETLFVAVPVK